MDEARIKEVFDNGADMEEKYLMFKGGNTFEDEVIKTMTRYAYVASVTALVSPLETRIAELKEELQLSFQAMHSYRERDVERLNEITRLNRQLNEANLVIEHFKEVDGGLMELSEENERLTAELAEARQEIQHLKYLNELNMNHGQPAPAVEEVCEWALKSQERRMNGTKIYSMCKGTFAVYDGKNPPETCPHCRKRIVVVQSTKRTYHADSSEGTC